MKKFLILIFALIMALSLAACEQEKYIPVEELLGEYIIDDSMFLDRLPVLFVDEYELAAPEINRVKGIHWVDSIEKPEDALLALRNYLLSENSVKSWDDSDLSGYEVNEKYPNDPLNIPGAIPYTVTSDSKKKYWEVWSPQLESGVLYVFNSDGELTYIGLGE